jgi:hypothetical protein
MEEFHNKIRVAGECRQDRMGSTYLAAWCRCRSVQTRPRDVRTMNPTSRLSSSPSGKMNEMSKMVFLFVIVKKREREHEPEHRDMLCRN